MPQLPLSEHHRFQSTFARSSNTWRRPLRGRRMWRHLRKRRFAPSFRPPRMADHGQFSAPAAMHNASHRCLVGLAPTIFEWLMRTTSCETVTSLSARVSSTCGAWQTGTHGHPPSQATPACTCSGTWRPSSRRRARKVSTSSATARTTSSRCHRARGMARMRRRRRSTWGCTQSTTSARRRCTTTTSPLCTRPRRSSCASMT
mmetsp:Transcript_73529/g.163372  ORF Transcript_73529/g.163372 Transcript_73529/m.163372 type:complete len:202 (+) Transcript_73529:714-1319(+)